MYLSFTMSKAVSRFSTEKLSFGGIVSFFLLVILGNFIVVSVLFPTVSIRVSCSIESFPIFSTNRSCEKFSEIGMKFLEVNLPIDFSVKYILYL